MKLTLQLSGDTCSPALDRGGHHDPLCELDHSSKLCKTLVLDEIYTRQPWAGGAKRS